jgi:predicted GIY-YIG superfamily endonuclease
MLDEKASVYGLKDKRNNEVFYVGMSIDPYARYGQHVAIRTAKSAKEDRILDMRKDGLMPELVIFEQDIPIEQAPERERHWIHFYLNRGIVLTNIHHANKKIEVIANTDCNYLESECKYTEYSLDQVHNVYEHACRVLERHEKRCHCCFYWEACDKNVKCDDYRELLAIHDKWYQIEKEMLRKLGQLQ